MATMTHLLHSSLPNRLNFHLNPRFSCTTPLSPSNTSSFSSPQHLSRSLTINRPQNPSPLILYSSAAGNGGIGIGNSGGSGGGGGGNWSSGGGGDQSSSSSAAAVGILGLLLSGWRSRVLADPQFPFKVLMEELVGVTACVLGDMATRPNFGLNELDFVFSTLVVGSILNFLLMYILAPTASTSAVATTLPSIFAGCPQSHMFEPGSFGLLQRFGTFVYKGAVFAGVGFAAGLLGTAISNGLIAMRKKMDPSFETPNKPPPTLLNAMTWAAHMGLSSNFRYQSLNGIEFLLERAMPPVVFKASVLVLRLLNNVLGGMTFVLLARLTGAQKGNKAAGDEDEKLLGGGAAASQ